MYKIKSTSLQKELPELPITPEVFHIAQNNSYHQCRICGSDGKMFDIEYLENDSRTPDYIKNNLPPGRKLIPDYLNYDENDTRDLSFGILTWAKRIIFETLDEYSIVLCRLALENTSCDVYFTNSDILSFVEHSEHLHICEAIPKFEDDRNLYVQEDFKYGYFEKNWHRLDSISLFHNIFILQSLLTIPRDAVKYVKIYPHPGLGIGGLLEQIVLLYNIISPKGWKLQYSESIDTLYSADFLNRYFNFDLSHEDSNTSNTINVDFLFFSSAVNRYTPSKLNLSSFNAEFLNGMEIYREAVINGSRPLGVLIRGTDYFSSQWHVNERKMSGTEEMIPFIRQWMKDYNYDLLFLATEDQDVLETMKKEFGNNLRAISQVRYRKSDFAPNQIIADKMKSSEKSADLTEDTTVNYFYGLYILSQCDAFICSGVCNGWTLVNQLNDGKFSHVKLFNNDTKKV